MTARGSSLPPLRSGDLRHRVTIRRPTQVEKPTGGFDTAWRVVATVWAEIRGLTGGEAVKGRVFQGISTYRLRVRWREGIDQDDQVTLPDGTELNIKSVVDPNGIREQLVILADTESVRSTN